MLMGDEDDALFRQDAFDRLIEDTVSDGWVDRGEGIVQQVDVGVHVDRASQADSSLLPARNIDSSLTYLSLPPI